MSGTSFAKDGFTGRIPRLVDELSGGQFVLVNEAVNLGIIIYNMRQGEGNRFETLFRDETVGTQDAANGKEYVRMLRHGLRKLSSSDLHLPLNCHAIHSVVRMGQYYSSPIALKVAFVGSV